MNEFEQAKKIGRITIYSDTPQSVEKAVSDYNERMGWCRVKRHHFQELNFALLVINPVVVISISAAMADSVFSKPLFGLVMLIAFAVTYLVFGVVKNNHIVVTFFAALLILLDWRFAILLAADVVLDILYYRLKSELVSQPGYPGFMDILVFYERSPKPKEINEK